MAAGRLSIRETIPGGRSWPAVSARVNAMRISLPRRAAVALLSLAVSLVWAAGTRLHLCSDGLRPPVTVHSLADGADHLGHDGEEGEHRDAEVEFDASLTRVSKNGTETVAIPVHAAHVSACVYCASLRSASVPSSVRSATRFLQPPLRAPPA